MELWPVSKEGLLNILMTLWRYLVGTGMTQTIGLYSASGGRRKQWIVDRLRVGLMVERRVQSRAERGRGRGRGVKGQP